LKVLPAAASAWVGIIVILLPVGSMVIIKKKKWLNLHTQNQVSLIIY
jgi:hypothetical protein